MRRGCTRSEDVTRLGCRGVPRRSHAFKVGDSQRLQHARRPRRGPEVEVSGPPFSGKSDDEPRRRHLDQKWRFAFRRRCKTLRAPRCIKRPLVPLQTALRRRRRRSRFRPLPEGPRGPFPGVLLSSLLIRQRRNVYFFRVRARLGPKRQKLKKVGFGVEKRTPRRAPEPSLRSPESARYRGLRSTQKATRRDDGFDAEFALAKKGGGADF